MELDIERLKKNTFRNRISESTIPIFFCFVIVGLLLFVIVGLDPTIPFYVNYFL